MKSVNKGLQNTQLKSFERQAVKLVEDAHYEAKDFENPNFMFKVHDEALVRLNATMERLNRGNSQIFVTMFYKDQDRAELIVKFSRKLLSSEQFKSMPKVFQEQELEQLMKLGPMSRFDIDTLMDNFVNHYDKTNAERCQDYDMMQRSFDALVEYQSRCAMKALKNDPTLQRFLDDFSDVSKYEKRLPKDKSGGYRYYSNVDLKIGGVTANELYFKDYQRWVKSPYKWMLYELFCRVQSKGNTIFDEYILGEPVSKILLPHKEVWKKEKNRVVQGDSRSCQFPHKPISDLLTQVVKAGDSNCLGWYSIDERIPFVKKYFKEFYSKYNFDSFDATDYDATTDPKIQEMGIRAMYSLARKLGLNPDAHLPEDAMVRHFLSDPTVTPKGIFLRKSTPSGHNFTGPAGTEINFGRAWRQTAELFNVSPEELIDIAWSYNEKGIPLFMCVGDDCVQLRDLNDTPESIAKKNQRDGYSNNADKILLSGNFFHYLQLGNYYDPKDPDNPHHYSVYFVARALEKYLFQETANEHTAIDASLAAQQTCSNCRYNPCLDILTEFEVEGDPKYRLGGINPGEFAKQAAKGRTVAEVLHREWDPVYRNMTWEEYALANRATYESISRAAQKFSKARSEL